MNTGANERKRALWDAVDFTQPGCLIAHEMGVNEQVVSYQRRKRGINIRAERWRGVDFSRPPREIAQELGVTYEAVTYQMRKRK
mgnify:CR=1 FL=1